MEHELAPFIQDAGIGMLVWSPLAAGRLGGKFRRDNPKPEGTRVTLGGGEGPERPELLYRIVDALDEIAAEVERMVETCEVIDTLYSTSQLSSS